MARRIRSLPQSERSCALDWLGVVVVLVTWAALQGWVLPRLGVAT